MCVNIDEQLVCFLRPKLMISTKMKTLADFVKKIKQRNKITQYEIDTIKSCIIIIRKDITEYILDENEIEDEVNNNFLLEMHSVFVTINSYMYKIPLH